ncbi:hypothetical protein HK101_007141 [Irineochytrium annulatum]|nr:hypothetical protein HK101_007141 [Irineochytrium annulatum]
MGFLTVLVQHAWAMQPSAGGALAGPDDTRQSQEDSTTTKSRREKPAFPSPSDVRVSVPSTVASFVKCFNDNVGPTSQNSPHAKERLESTALDVLARLENLVLSSAVPDPFRKRREKATSVIPTVSTLVSATGEPDYPQYSGASVHQQQQQQRHLTMKPSPFSSKHPEPPASTSQASERTRHYVAQARRSLLALTRARARWVRFAAFELLVEALDTNELGSDDAEVASLLLLVNETVTIIEQCVFGRRRRSRRRREVVDGEVKDVVEGEVYKVAVDEHLEKLLVCVSLAIQRLEYACEVKAFYIPQEVQSSFQRLLEVYLPSLITDDPYIAHLVESTGATIKWLISTKVEAEELMASPVALSLLSQITRMMAPPDLVEMKEPFFGILADLMEKQEWHLGRKFIKLLAVSATLHIDACHLFLSLLKRLDRPKSWQWLYLGLLCLGVTVLSSSQSQIRKLAMEEGLLIFINAENPNPDDSDDHLWRIRAGVAEALLEIQRQRKSDVVSLLAHEAIRERKLIEKHPLVLQALSGLPFETIARNGVPSKSSTSHARQTRKLSFLYKYICAAMAETYGESQSRYMYLRKYLRTTDRRGKKHHHHQEQGRPGGRRGRQMRKKGNALARLRPESQIRMKAFWGSEADSGSRGGRSPMRNVFVDDDDSELGLDIREVQGGNQDDDGDEFEGNDDGADGRHDVVALSGEPYHLNYRRMPESEDYDVEEPPETPQVNVTDHEQPSGIPASLGPSILSTYPYNSSSAAADAARTVFLQSNAVPSSQRPCKGSFNRRKLFNSTRPGDGGGSDGSRQAPVKGLKGAHVYSEKNLRSSPIVLPVVRAKV